MKICSKCTNEKPLDKFNYHDSTKDKRSAWCSQCMLEGSKRYYDINKKKQLSKARGERYNMNILLKEGKQCEKCGETNHIMLDFHHIDPKKKDFNISDLVKRRKDIDEIKEEIEKCEVLCSNCHRIEHWDEKNKL